MPKKPLDVKRSTIYSNKEASGDTGAFELHDGPKRVSRAKYKKTSSDSINGAANATSRAAKQAGRSVRLPNGQVLNPEDDDEEDEGLISKIARFFFHM